MPQPEEVFLYACGGCDLVYMSSFPYEAPTTAHCAFCKSEQPVRPLTVESNGRIVTPPERR